VSLLVRPEGERGSHVDNWDKGGPAVKSAEELWKRPRFAPVVIQVVDLSSKGHPSFTFVRRRDDDGICSILDYYRSSQEKHTCISF